MSQMPNQSVGLLRDFFNVDKRKKTVEKSMLKKQNPLKINDLKGVSVPGTGFEPAHGFPRCDLNTVRLPISPPGHIQGPVAFSGL